MIEATDFVDKGGRYTKRFCHFINGLCRYISIHAVSKRLDIRWETVKNIDKAFLLSTLPALEPKKLTNLVYIDVDEVARAKGHDYMTVVYDLVSGYLSGLLMDGLQTCSSTFLNNYHHKRKTASKRYQWRWANLTNQQ